MKHYRIWVVSLVNVSFLFAANYCLLEALEADSTHPEQSHHETPASSDSKDDGTPCCVALQAIDTPRTAISLNRPIASSFHPLVFDLPGIQKPIEPFRLVKDFGPSITGPPRSTEFYYTSFATHAPPVFLT
jgi:hypothetical protein